MAALGTQLSVAARDLEAAGKDSKLLQQRVEVCMSMSAAQGAITNVKIHKQNDLLYWTRYCRTP